MGSEMCIRDRVEAVNAALEELKADGTLQSIVDKYITAD